MLCTAVIADKIHSVHQLHNIIWSNSAVNIVISFVMIVMALGTMIGTGGSAVVSAQLGKGKEREAKENFTFLCTVCFAACCVVSVLAFIFRDPLLRLLGANDAVF